MTGSPRFKLTVTEVLVIDAVIKNSFNMTYAGYDLEMSQPTVSCALTRFLAKLPDPSKFFTVPLRGEAEQGGKRVIGLTSAGFTLYKKHIEPLAKHYLALIEELNKDNTEE